MRKEGCIMAGRTKGPKQQKEPKLPQSPKQPYGEPLSGSKKEKTAKHSGEKHNPQHGM